MEAAEESREEGSAVMGGAFIGLCIGMLLVMAFAWKRL